MAFDPTKTTDIQALVFQWSGLPVGDLFKILGGPGFYRYAYIGTEDRTMYPLIVPGAIVQIDEQRKHILSGPWLMENQRPIYFLETRDGFACCWCSLNDGSLILQSHPLSMVPSRVLHSREVEIIGQVVAIAMRLEVCEKTARS